MSIRKTPIKGLHTQQKHNDNLSSMWLSQLHQRVNVRPAITTCIADDYSAYCLFLMYTIVSFGIL